MRPVGMMSSTTVPQGASPVPGGIPIGSMPPGGPVSGMPTGVPVSGMPGSIPVTGMRSMVTGVTSAGGPGMTGMPPGSLGQTGPIMSRMGQLSGKGLGCCCCCLQQMGCHGGRISIHIRIFQKKYTPVFFYVCVRGYK